MSDETLDMLMAATDYELTRVLELVYNEIERRELLIQFICSNCGEVA